MAADPLTAATVNGLLNIEDSDHDDPFNDRPSTSPRYKRKAVDELDASLGLDEEVKVTKKRKPISKLDEARLLSAPGIPKLRADARSGKFSKKLRLKGKGHEFSDVARLLNYYQLWLDNLYPRAKFADGLQLIEKVGHSRRMQVMRKEWIDEGKPGYIRDREAKKMLEKEKEMADKETDDLFAGDHPVAESVEQEAVNAVGGAEDDSLFVPDARNKANDGNDDGMLPDDDDLDALLAEQETRITTRPLSMSKPTEDNDSEGDDDLDALLAEQEMSREPPPLPPTSQHTSTFAPKLNPSPFGGGDSDDDDDGMDDLDALLAEQEARMQPSTAQSKPSSRQASITQNKERTAPAADQEITQDDELDALIAEQEARQHVISEAPLSSPSAARPATFRPAPSVADEADDADGADMFSSSPLRGTAPIGLGLSGQLELGLDPNPDTAGPRSSSLTAPAARTQESEASESEDAETSKAGDSIEAEAPAVEEKEESQGLDADDMFSSSPVQND
ncbi:uncharacterized protein Z520_08655 [Fonsecaea multimorphosa CBS 102226]|uniref:Chromosome segregation in meiosis protein n=1 Tax=Fonsecaea multimorphosa CBS 102226 TaxID=1442371 RepID=A0A0D2H129_9EURO|nr:uncharacterized protein Z520_08655 [Fonsecaea multimorphosa CBS 102226]KIX95535.1 hypothetical protein Z520_08655 [Fonsecaea multimorphosa CBS 102226]OAL21381.1 hypothetical protein AYO22_08104 [Fonsecaea multimorphosa]